MPKLISNTLMLATLSANLACRLMPANNFDKKFLTVSQGVQRH